MLEKQTNNGMGTQRRKSRLRRLCVERRQTLETDKRADRRAPERFYSLRHRNMSTDK